MTETISIADDVRACGVVGAGGAGFPTAVKLSATVDTVIVNGAACEPLLASDIYLLEREAARVLRGLRYLMGATKADTGVVAVKKKHAEAVRALSAEMEGVEKCSLHPLDDYYPAGDELVLIHDVTGRIVPEGGLPPRVGCLVENVETTLNVYEACENRRPVTRRYLTCTGEVRRPSVVRAHLGAAIADIIDLCGGSTVDDPAVLVGGPLMGRVETDLAAPVAKTTTGLVVLERSHELVMRKTIPLEHMIRRAKSVCCQCTYCTDMCPRFLLGHDLSPHLIMRQIGYGIGEPTRVVESALLCSGCGVCETYACVMGLSPQRINEAIKRRLAAAGYRTTFPERDVTVNGMLEYRRVPSSRVVNRLRLEGYANRELMRVAETAPRRVELLMTQHAGSPAIPVVKEGDVVHEGDLVGEEPADSLSARVHASIDGRVVFVDDERVILERG